ncbi:hypothetical protein [Lichenicola sp.]|uniref:hypothetical protein n=1 Tax=Lichenicola sp. TaxID=2804529 RepID=UPI003B00FE98
MERHEVLDLMREFKLAGMQAAYDEVLSDALKRQHPSHGALFRPARNRVDQWCDGWQSGRCSRTNTIREV